MKVLQIGKFYPVRGGIEKVMYDLMIGLSTKGVYCDMLCASTEDYPAGTVQINAFAQLMVMPTKFKLAATMLAPSMISKLRKCAKDYDVIHIHHPDPMACLALFLSGYKGRVILHWHSDILKQKLLLKLYAPLQAWLIKRADLIVGTTPVYVHNSPFLRDVQEKVDYIPIGVEPILADSTKVAEIRRKYEGKNMVFCLGRLVEYKGYRYLIEAAAKLDDNYKIVIGGIGPLRQELEVLIDQLRIRDRVEFLGFVKDEDVPNYFAACDLFCLSSIWKTEAFAIVQIEAMSCGKPVVSTHIESSGVSWVNADGVSGLVVPAEDANQLVAAIRKLFDDTALYNKLSEGGLSRYQELFTRERMVGRARHVYERILNVKCYGEKSD